MAAVRRELRGDEQELARFAGQLLRVAAIRGDESIYSKYEGIDALRRAIARKMADYNGVTCDPDSGACRAEPDTSVAAGAAEGRIDE